MGLVETILEQGGGKVVGQLVDRLDLGGGDVDMVKSAVASLLPQFTAQVVEKAEGDPKWAGRFAEAVNTGKHEKYLDQPDALAEETTAEDGNKILGHVLGSKDASRAVAEKTAKETGLDLGLAKKALPVVATLAMGAMSKNGALGGLLGKVDADDVVGALKKLM